MHALCVSRLFTVDVESITVTTQFSIRDWPWNFYSEAVTVKFSSWMIWIHVSLLFISLRLLPDHKNLTSKRRQILSARKSSWEDSCNKRLSYYFYDRMASCSVCSAVNWSGDPRFLQQETWTSISSHSSNATSSLTVSTSVPRQFVYL